MKTSIFSVFKYLFRKHKYIQKNTNYKFKLKNKKVAHKKVLPTQANAACKSCRFISVFKNT